MYNLIYFGFPMLLFLFLNIPHCDSIRFAKKGEMHEPGCIFNSEDSEIIALSIHFCLNELTLHSFSKNYGHNHYEQPMHWICCLYRFCVYIFHLCTTFIIVNSEKFLLQILFCLVLIKSMIVLEVVVENFILNLYQFFSIVVVIELVGSIIYLVFRFFTLFNFLFL